MHPFDEDLSLARLGPARYRGRITGNWSINGIPNGGYLLALMANAMLRESEKRTPIVVTANYFHRSLIGDADLALENIALSKSFDRWQATLSQEGRERIRATGTFVDDRVGPGEREYEKQPPEIPAPEACIPMPTFPNFTLLDRIDVRLDPACAGWLEGRPTERSEQRGWVRFREGRRPDMLSALFIADSFPPPILASHGMFSWVPTIELSVNLRNRPGTEWLKGVFRTSFINDGILEEDGEVWDGDGELIAISRQIAQFRKATA
ncbi:thioesterase family protein [Thermodesulfobacteriota bacterium]